MPGNKNHLRKFSFSRLYKIYIDLIFAFSFTISLTKALPVAIYPSGETACVRRFRIKTVYVVWLYVRMKNIKRFLQGSKVPTLGL